MFCIYILQSVIEQALERFELQLSHDKDLAEQKVFERLLF